MTGLVERRFSQNDISLPEIVSLETEEGRVYEVA